MVEELPKTLSDAADDLAIPLPPGWLSRWPWVTFLLPMVVYMILGSFDPTPADPTPSDPTPPNSSFDGDLAEVEASARKLPDFQQGFFADDRGGGFVPAIRYSFYPYVYTAKILATLVAMLLVWRGYRTFRGRVSGLAIVVGVVGVVLWIVICHLRIESKIVGPIDRYLGSFIPGLEEGDTPTIGMMSLLGTGERSAYNPLDHLAAAPTWAYVFLAIRFLGLAVIVPVIEEFFLRGFLMRYVVHPQWWQVPFGAVNRMAVIVGTAVPMLMHPGELLAALVWFSMVTWLMIRTRNIWDCVVAHATTNLLLGIYVVVWDQWQLM